MRILGGGRGGRLVQKRKGPSSPGTTVKHGVSSVATPPKLDAFWQPGVVSGLFSRNACVPRAPGQPRAMLQHISVTQVLLLVCILAVGHVSVMFSGRFLRTTNSSKQDGAMSALQTVQELPQLLLRIERHLGHTVRIQTRGINWKGFSRGRT